MKMHEKILQSATNLFDTKGIQASGVDTIIAEAGIAKATLYKYFPSKNQLIIAYLRSKSDRFYAWLEDNFGDRKRDSLDILLQLCELFEAWITTPKFHGLPFHIAAIEFPNPEHPVNDYSVALSKELQGYLTKLADIAGAKDPITLGQQLAIIFEGAATIERLNPGGGAALRAKQAAITLVKGAV